MINRKSAKQEITERVLQEIPKSYPDHNLTIDQVIFKWWMTGRQEGMRLTEHGMTMFQVAEIEHYTYEFKQQGKSWHPFLMEISKKIKCPYYLGTNKTEKVPYIRLYDSKIAMMLSLYGDLNGYLESIKVR